MPPDRYAYILVAEGKYWKRLCQKKGSKGVHSFVRRNRVAPKASEQLLFYVKKPVMRILGGALFLERLTGQTQELWAKYGAETCFESYAEYNEFVQNRTNVTFVRFRDFYELDDPKSTTEIHAILGTLQGFRGKYVNKETADQLTL
jgi:predicted transcriptional regulator